MMAAADIATPDFKDAPYWWEAAPPSTATVQAPRYQTALKIAGKAVAPCAFEGLPFPTRPTYTGDPWFLPVVGGYYRLRDWLERRLAV